MDGLFDTPNNLWEHQLREILTQPEVKKDPLFQILTAVFQNTAHITDVADIYRLLDLENFSRLVHLLDGRTVKFPTSTELKDSIILTLCYYYRKVEKLEWKDIHRLLPFDFPSIAVSRKISSLDEMIQEKINPFMTEGVMEEVQGQAREVLASLDDKRLRNDALRVASTDSLGEMKDNLIQFFKDRIATIRRSDELRDTIYVKLNELLGAEGLTLEQVLSVYRTLSKDDNTAAADVLGLFKPVPGTPSLFLEVSRPPDRDEELKLAHRNYSAEELQTLDRMMGHLASIAKSGGGEKTVQAEVVN